MRRSLSRGLWTHKGEKTLRGVVCGDWQILLYEMVKEQQDADDVMEV